MNTDHGHPPGILPLSPILALALSQRLPGSKEKRRGLGQSHGAPTEGAWRWLPSQTTS